MSEPGKSNKKMIWIFIAVILALFGGTTCLCVGLGGATFLGISKGIGESTPATEAVAKAKAHPKVKEALGEPMERVGMPMGNINITNDSGRADLQLKLKGSKGEGMLMVNATKLGGVWSFQDIKLTPTDGAAIDVLAP